MESSLVHLPESRPSFEELAAEAFAHARYPDADDRIRDRIKMLRFWWRLRRVARWQHPSYDGRFRFLWAQGVRRNGLALYGCILAIAAIQAIRNPIAAPFAWLASMAYLGLFCAVGGIYWAAITWTDLADEKEWGEMYRTARMKLEQRSRWQDAKADSPNGAT